MNSFADIDRDRLDEEWVNQPKRYRKYAEKLAGAKKRHSEAKQQLDVAKAEAAKKIRKNPSKYGIGRATEASVKEAVVLHPVYKAALTAFIDATYEMDIYEAATKALEHRKSALKDLVFLWGASYFASHMKTNERTKDNVRERLTESSLRESVTRKRKEKK